MALEGLVIDKERKIITAEGKSILLSEREFSLFLLFYENPETIFSKENILETIWKDSAGVGVVAVLILKLRRKIRAAKRALGCIKTEYGSGYYFAPPKTEDT